jgi:hypothetical protein
MLKLSMHGPTTSSSGDSQFIYFLGKQKQKISDETPGHRLVLIGGSGTLYSVRANILESQLGLPVINNALHAGLGINYLLYRARKSLRSGDTAILFIEYPLYDSKISWAEADYVLPYDLSYFAAQRLKNKVEMVKKLTSEEYLRRVYDAAFGEILDGNEILNRINGHGDLMSNLHYAQKDFHRLALDKLNPINVIVKKIVKKEEVSAITNFIRWCHERDITVIGGYPATLDFPIYHSDAKAQEFFQSLENYYHSFGVPTLGGPSDFMFPKSMFFDSHFHMHDEGAEVMTNLVALRLKLILPKVESQSRH